MDDLKLFAANDNHLASIIRIVNKFSDDIAMSIGIDNCKKVTIQRGQIAHMENIQLDNGEELKSPELNQRYKYQNQIQIQIPNWQNNQIITQIRTF